MVQDLICLAAVLDCIFATIVYKSALMQNILKNSLVLYAPTVAAIMLTFIIYLAYYHMTVHTCCKAVLTK